MEIRRRVLQHEQVPVRAGESLFVNRITLPEFPFNWHCHPECELAWIISGSGLRYVGDAVEDFTAGDLCLIGPDLPHTWVSPPMRASAVVVQFPADLFAAWERHPEGLRLAELLRRSRQGFRLNGPLAATVITRLETLERTKPGPQRLAALVSLLAEIAAQPQHLTTLAAAVPSEIFDARWGALIGHLHQHAGGTIVQEGMARRLGMTPSAFARAFRRRFGATFTDYLAKLRVRRACSALTSTAVPILDIAEQAGFASLSAFNRRFRALVGSTPRSYRARMRVGSARD